MGTDVVKMQYLRQSAALMAVTAALIFGANGLAAQSQQGVLVELFTAQGCPACPPADAFLKQLTQEPGVIPLALHVDYWNYMGWQDTFAQDQFSNRQRRYAKTEAERMVYTPQMIIAGTARVKGYDQAKARAEIARARSDVTLTLRRIGDEIVISATPNTAISGDFVVDLVRYRPQSVVVIERGENGGREGEYHNIVTEWLTLGQWNGQDPLIMRARAAGDAPVVVVVQRKGPAEVVAAAVLK